MYSTRLRSEDPLPAAEPEAAPAELIWSKLDRRSEPAQPSLTTARVVAAAVAVADAEGLDQLTMRRVGAELGTSPMALYRHVASKEDLLDLVLDEVIAGPATVRPTGDWREDLAALARSHRANAQRHPWMLILAANRPPLGPNALRRMEFTLRAMDGLDLDITTIRDLQNTVQSYVAGAVQTELAEAEARRRRGLTDEQWRASVAPYVRQVVESGRYPMFSRLITEAQDRSDDDRFEIGLRLVLDGITAFLDRHRAGTAQDAAGHDGATAGDGPGHRTGRGKVTR
jgi:AcrR family transcriptional regulator